MTPDAHDATRHLASCYAAIARALDEGAGEVADADRAAWFHAAVTVFGDLVAATGEEAPAPFPPIEDVLGRALSADPSGAMALYALVMVVGPRLLATLRDVREAFPDPATAGIVDAGATAVVAEILALSAALGPAALVADEDPGWRVSARALVSTLDDQGFGDSFGVSR